eukprot:185779-Prorocentrum_minimum.AAC.1
MDFVASSLPPASPAAASLPQGGGAPTAAPRRWSQEAGLTESGLADRRSSADTTNGVVVMRSSHSLQSFAA